MDDQELLKVAELVLSDAIADAEFSRLAKDVSYVNVVAEKIEKLRAKIAGRTPAGIRLELVGGRMMVQYSIPELSFFPRVNA